MKTAWLALLAALLVACAPAKQQQSATGQDAPGAPPAPHATDRLRELARQPSPVPPPGTPDGPFQATDSHGRTLKTVVRNGKFDRYAEIYHPNGRLHSRTTIRNGMRQGWSSGHTPEGTLRTRILYRNDRAVRWQRFDARGHLQQEGVF